MSGVPTSSLMSSGIGIYKVGLTTKKMRRNIFKTCLNSLNSLCHISKNGKILANIEVLLCYSLVKILSVHGGKSILHTATPSARNFLLISEKWFLRLSFFVCVHEEAGFSKQPFFSVKWLFCLENTALMLQFLCSSK